MKKKNLGRYHQQEVNARRRRGRSLMKRMKSKGEMTEPWGTPALIECKLERKPSTLTAIGLSERKLPIHLMRV